MYNPINRVKSQGSIIIYYPSRNNNTARDVPRRTTPRYLQVAGADAGAAQHSEVQGQWQVLARVQALGITAVRISRSQAARSAGPGQGCQSELAADEFDKEL